MAPAVVSLPSTPRSVQLSADPASIASPYRNNASLILPVSVTTKQDMIHVAKTLCSDLFGPENGRQTTLGTGDDDDDDDKSTLACSVRPLSGGLSNELFVVSSMEENDSVLVRIHPPSKEIVDRQVENRIMAWLSLEGVAPTFYGRFLNGRVEEFYQNHGPLSWHDMPRYGPQVAVQMARLHGLMVPTGILLANDNNKSGGEFFGHIESWLQLVASQQQESNNKLDQVLDLDTLHKELTWLKQELTSGIDDSSNAATRAQAISFCRNVVFTHMDCQSLNILVNKEGKDLRLIDFEYAGLNPRAVDIANTFCEYCDMSNLKANYETQYPSKAQQDEFLEPYLYTVDPKLTRELRENNQWDVFLTTMRHEIGRHALLSHLGWAVWSIVQSQMSTIDFDYIAYAKVRMEGFEYFRSKYWTSQE